MIKWDISGILYLVRTNDDGNGKGRVLSLWTRSVLALRRSLVQLHKADSDLIRPLPTCGQLMRSGWKVPLSAYQCINVGAYSRVECEAVWKLDGATKRAAQATTLLFADLEYFFLIENLLSQLLQGIADTRLRNNNLGKLYSWAFVKSSSSHLTANPISGIW